MIPARRPGRRWPVRALVAAGVPARQIAVLVRINADTERFEQALAEPRCPYLVRGAERFYERPVVRQALCCSAAWWWPRRGCLATLTP